MILSASKGDRLIHFLFAAPAVPDGQIKPWAFSIVHLTENRLMLATSVLGSAAGVLGDLIVGMMNLTEFLQACQIHTNTYMGSFYCPHKRMHRFKLPLSVPGGATSGVGRLSLRSISLAYHDHFR